MARRNIEEVEQVHAGAQQQHAGQGDVVGGLQLGGALVQHQAARQRADRQPAGRQRTG